MIRSKPRVAPATPLVLLALAALALAGCGRDARPIARVGRHTLTVGDFIRAAGRSNVNPAMPADEARPMLLEQMVRDELMLVAAEAHGLDTTTFTRQRRRAATEQALLGALSAQLAPTDPGVTEAELRTFYQWRKTESNVQLVFAPDSLLLVIAKQRLAAGEPFTRVSDQFSGFGVLPPGGRIGYRLPGTLPQPLDDAARTLPAGVVGGPYHSSVGWFLLTVLDRRPASEPPFEQERAALQTLLRKRKWQGTLLASVERLAPEYHLSLSADGAQRLYHLLSPGRVNGTTDPAPTAAERATLLATFDGGSYTLGDAWDDLGRTDIGKPNVNQVPAIREWVRDRVITRIAMTEARRRHLDQDPAVAGPLADQMNEYIARGEFQTVAGAVAPPDEATLRATWEPMKERFPMLNQAHVAWVTVADTAKAVAIAQSGGRGSLRDVAHAVDPALEVHEETLRFPTSDPQWASAQGALQQLQPGQWARPEVTPAGFRMLQLLDGVRGTVSWDQLPQDVRQSLANSLMQRARDARVAAYTDSLRRAIQPVLMPEALRSVPWPVSAVAAP